MRYVRGLGLSALSGDQRVDRVIIFDPRSSVLDEVHVQVIVAPSDGETSQCHHHESDSMAGQRLPLLSDRLPP